MKSKLQILKESASFVCILFLSNILIYFLHSSLFRFDNEWITNFGILVSFLITCLILGLIFEKEKPLWQAFLKFLLIGIVSSLFSIVLILIGFPFFFDWGITIFASLWKPLAAQNFFTAIILAIPLFVLGILFLAASMIGFFLLTYFVGSFIFSYLIQIVYDRFIHSRKEKL
jgi:hypothetical protein